MKKDIKKPVMPATVAPVQRETAATVSRDGGAIAPLVFFKEGGTFVNVPGIGPFAGDDAE